MEAFLRKRDLLFQLLWQTIVFHALGKYILLEYLFFLIRCITRHFDPFKPVQKGGKDCFEGICRANEKHLGKIYLDIDVVVLELVILNRVQHFHYHILKACSASSCLNFINFIQQYDWVFGLCLENGVKYFSWICANISFSMSFHD